MDLFQHKKDDENNNLARTEAADTGKKKHGKEEKQHNHSPMEHVGGREIDVKEYIEIDAMSAATSILHRKYEAATKEKMVDKVVRLIGAEEANKEHKEEEAGWEKNKGVYQF
ncbi:uncharacterized protein LOC133889049 [Phragmites australis]|uniref:uncharacterized protein LOC133889049 n=1 Tax=Phragmites australis TaxID=29695 RepID=UPI002D790AD2|nr:uncharacterized protein LOC133889049 [Phragmites australis]